MFRRYYLLAPLALFACSSAGEGDDSNATATGGSGAPAGGNANSAAGSAGSASGQAGNAAGGSAGSDVNAGGQGPGSGGTAADAGASSGGASGGSAGQGGAGGVSTGGGSAGIEEGDTVPWRELNVQVQGAQITHGKAGLDTRAAKMMGKLIIDLGVDSGTYLSWLGKRGFHVMGIGFYHCNIGNNLGRDHNGDCRLNSFDGMPHGDQNNVGPADSISGQVQAQLTQLHSQYPEEDWGYFLNEDGTVRWSDVGFTGISHGSSTAARIGHAVRIYRAVSRSGPRDNGCGTGAAQGDFDRNNPPWDPNCAEEEISSWLDEPSVTPLNRYYALVGIHDGQYGDDMFNLERRGIPGEPLRWDLPGADVTSSNRYIADEGHFDFLAAPDGVPNTDAALNQAFGVPPENQNPDF